MTRIDFYKYLMMICSGGIIGSLLIMSLFYRTLNWFVILPWIDGVIFIALCEGGIAIYKGVLGLRSVLIKSEGK